MKNKRQKNYAFIDSQNLNLATQELKWKLDFQRFYVYLKERYGVKKAFLFIGYVPGNEALYTFLQQCGYVVIFKPTLEFKTKDKDIVRIKGNVDAELVLHAMIEYVCYQKAIIVSGDGDFHCLIEYLERNKKLARVMIPNRYKFSALLRKFRKYFVFISDSRRKLEKRQNKKRE